jgi:3-dehydrotetronate 4-kinase
MAEAARLLLGCIADDFTGATDLANTLVRRGMRTIQTIGVPSKDQSFGDAEAIVVALKTRTAPREKAVAQSLAACRWLSAHDARQFFFKYCSTFDSTPAGNIGPVADALLDDLGADFTTICPAFPENGRTVYRGHLFVDDALLSESAMRHHPLTPMEDANLLRLLGPQTARQVGLIAWQTVRQGVSAIRSSFARLRANGIAYAVVDALEESDLMALCEAGADLKLLTGGSGAAAGLPENFRRLGELPERRELEDFPAVGGGALVLSGSCSAATLRQVEAMRAKHPSLKLDPFALSRDRKSVMTQLLDWALPKIRKETPVLIYASAPPDEVKRAQQGLGAAGAGSLLEGALAEAAKMLVGSGVRRLIIAGGETAGAVVTALGLGALRIGRQIEAGVPVTLSAGEPQISLVLKSGNFGSDEFFLRALAALR